MKNYLTNSADIRLEILPRIFQVDKYYGHGRLNATNAVSQVLTTNETDNFKTTILPNPSKDFFTINYPLDVSTQIFDFRGVLIKKTKDKIIDITNLESGIYLVMITNSSGQINYQKLIKK